MDSVYRLGSWGGRRGTAPSAQQLARIAEDESLDRRLLASELLAHSAGLAPDHLCELLAALAGGDALRDLLVDGGLSRGVCGAVFRPGDMVWTCQSCGKDGTCVQCNSCFQESDHAGHDVHFHLNQGGSGCCDCGDAEAWRPEGCCARHLGARQVLPEAETSLSRDLATAVRAVVSAVVSAAVQHCVECARGHSSTTAPEPSTPVVALLHNDDVHTFDEVAEQLVLVGMRVSKAHELTHAVDGEGSAALAEGQHATLLARFEPLREFGLLLALVSSAVHANEAGIAAALDWLVELGEEPRMRRLITEVLLEGGLLSGAASGYDPFAAQDQFPRVFPYLALRSEEARSLLPGAASPFIDAAPRVPLALLIAASPYQGKGLQTRLNSLALTFQHEKLFKSAFSQLLALLYPTLTLLFAQFVGTDDYSVFSVSVQMYTAQSMADLVSSDCATDRLPFPEYTVELVPTSLRCMTAVLLEGGHLSGNFLLSDSVRKRRLHHICRDLEYLLSNHKQSGSTATLRVLLGLRDESALSEWLRLLGLLQGIFPVQRRTGAHVETEDSSWQEAANLVLEVLAVGTTLLGQGLFCIGHVDARREAAQRVLRMALGAVEATTLEGVQVHPMMESLSALGVSVRAPLAVSATAVSRGRLSVLLPLSRFVAKVVRCAVHAGVESERMVDIIKENSAAVTLVLEGALRCLAWSAQVNVGMWRRNGDSVANLNYNYQRGQLCRDLRDLDLGSVQLAVLALGPDVVLARAVERFEVAEVLLGGSAGETAGPLLAELLRVIIHVAVHVPTDLSTNEGACGAIRLELAQRVLADHSASKLRETESVFKEAKDAGMLGDGLLRQLLRAMTSRRETASAVLLSLRPQFTTLLDIEHPHASRSDLEKVTEAARQRRKDSLGSASSRSEPIVHQDALPNVGQSILAPVRHILQSSGLFRVLERSLRLCLGQGDRLGSALGVTLGRVVFLLTLQVHCVTPFDDALVTLWRGEDGTALASALAQVQMQGVFSGDELFRQGLEFVLRELSARVDVIADVLRSAGLRIEGEAAHDEEEMTRRRREQARRRAMGKISAGVESFASLMAEGGHGMDTSEETHVLDAGASECVVCKSVIDKPLALMAFCQTSTVVKHLVARAAGSHKGEYIATRNGLAIRASCGDDGVFVAEVRRGERVTTVERRGPWLRVAAPAQGWTRLYSTRSIGTGTGTGTAPDIRTDPLLFPVGELEFRKWGAARVHVSSCGHTIHQHCLDALLARTASTRASQVAVNPLASEYLCPLCASISNCALPHVPPHLLPRSQETDEAGQLSTSIQWRRSVVGFESMLRRLFLQDVRSVMGEACAPLLTLASAFVERVGSFGAAAGSLFTAASALAYSLVSAADAQVSSVLHLGVLSLTVLKTNASGAAETDEVRQGLFTLFMGSQPRTATASRPVVPHRYAGLTSVSPESMCAKFDFWDVPLLDHDLATLLVLALATVHVAHRQVVVELLCVARLAQACLEPVAGTEVEMTSQAQQQTVSPLSPAIAAGLDLFRQRVCAAAGLVTEPPSLGTLVDRWCPFLQTALLASTAVEGGQPSESLCGSFFLGKGQEAVPQVVPALADLLRALNLSLTAFVDSEGWRAAVDRWAGLQKCEHALPLSTAAPADEIAPAHLPISAVSQRDMEAALEAALLADDDPNVGFELVRYFQSMGASSSRGEWDLVGLDPVLASIWGTGWDGRLVGDLSGLSGLTDRSHLSPGAAVRSQCGLISLPESFSELYCSVLETARAFPMQVDEPALCLVCGRVMFAGNRRAGGGSPLTPGECTLHAKGCGAGTGIFYLCGKGATLLVSGLHAVYQSQPLYVDEDGEVDLHMRHNKALRLSAPRLQVLNSMHLRHEVAREIARQRHFGTGNLLRPGWY